jgi:hypothetical protein
MIDLDDDLAVPAHGEREYGRPEENASRPFIANFHQHEIGPCNRTAMKCVLMLAQTVSAPWTYRVRAGASACKASRAGLEQRGDGDESFGAERHGREMFRQFVAFAWVSKLDGDTWT